MNNEWSTEILKRFNGRMDLGKEGLYDQYFKPVGLEKSAVFECLEQIEYCYGIPSGVMRPEDSLRKLTDRVETNNPIKWFLWLGENEFSDDDLIDELRIRMEKNGNLESWREIRTLEDYVRAWCGDSPGDPSDFNDDRDIG